MKGVIDLQGHKKLEQEKVQFTHSQRKRLCRTLKTEYTFIRYVPVVGARASATSAMRHNAGMEAKE